MRKRIISTLMALCMALTLLPVQVLAANYTVGEDASVSARALAGTAGTKLKADNIDAYVANGLGSGVYTLAEDVTISGTLRVTGEATVDLNGHVLRYAETANPDSIFHVEAGRLTLTDSRPEAEHGDENLPAGGLITGGKGYRYDGGGGGYHIYYYYGGGVYVEAGASFVLAGGTIYACGVQSGATAAFGGGIYAEGGSVTMTGGAIRNCAVSSDYGASGGAIYAKAGSVTMSGGVISGCSAMDGGGILTSGCTVQITGGRIENCKASERGGGLSVSGHTNGPVSVLDTVISGCEAKRGGGLALIGFAELELGENARITGCTATEKDDTEAGAIEYGAAVYTDLNNPLTVNYPGNFLYANGGRVEGSVYMGPNGCDQPAEIKATNAIDHTDGKSTTVFTGDVYCEGDIRGGIFHGSVTVPDSNGNMADVSKYDYWKFCSNLSGGTFYGPVTTECHVSGGTFYRGLTMNKNAKLSGQPIQTTGKPGPTTNIPDPAGNPVTVIYTDGSGEYAKQIVQKGEKAIQPDVPSRQGYQFTDWYLDDTKYGFNAAVTGDMTLTAKWTVCDHKGSTAQPTCTTPAICTACGGTLAALGHEWGPWTSGSDNTHTRACKRDGTHTETKDCSGGTATCTAKAVCTVCGGEYGEMAAHSFTAEKAEAQYLKSAATCTEKAIYYKSCAVCGLSSEGTADEATFFSGNALGHTWGAWTSNGNGTHTRRCGTDGCTGTETKDCAGGTATCTAKAVCSVCGKSYGAVDTANHDLKHTAAKEPGAFVTGRIEYWTCRICGKYFADAGGAKEISRDDIIIPRLGTAADSEGGKVSPATFDAGIGASAVTAVTSLAGLALLRRKRRDGE